ncbi:MAG: response regulator [Candidatus Eremiobacterota bacterium]
MSDELRVSKRDGSAFRFMIVDDSEFIRKNLRLAIQMLGGEVVGECRDGPEAVERYRKLRPDLVTCDIVMPTMSGVDVVRHLIGIDPDAKVIMVSSLGHQEQVRDAVARGARYFIVKPFRPMDAATRIAALIRKLYA